MTYDLENAQNELNKRRQKDGVKLPRPAASFVERALKDDGFPSDASPPPERPPLRPDRAPKRVTLADLDITHPRLQEAVDAARAWAERKRSGHDDASLVLLGPYGTGKTHIARAVLWSMVQAAVDEDGELIHGTERPVGRFYLADALIQALDGQTFVSSLIGNAPILVIDDVGSEQEINYISAGAQEREKQHRYFKIINHCYDFQVSLVMTSNLTIPELRDCIGGRAWSRLAQMAPAGFIVDLSGVPDYRLKASGRQ